MHKDRLLKTAEYLDTVIRATPEKFDMSFWAIDEKKCGTVCCAFGHACFIPEFVADGLKLGPRNNALSYSPVFGGKEGIEAAIAFYEIDMDQATYLFAPERYLDEDRGGYWEVTLDAVVNRLREFVSSGGIVRVSEDEKYSYSDRDYRDHN